MITARLKVQIYTIVVVGAIIHLGIQGFQKRWGLPEFHQLLDSLKCRPSFPKEEKTADTSD